MRALILVASSALVLGCLTSYEAVADVPTCEGRSATIVGTQDGTVTGTPGDDIIVTNGAVTVTSGDGDDLVCATGTPSAGTVSIDTGAGADTVDTTATESASDTVLAPPPPSDRDGPIRDLDSFVGGPGIDTVTNNGGGPVQIDTGPGDDVVTATLQTEHSSYDGGPGQNTLHLVDPATNAEKAQWVVDNTTGTATRSRSTVVAWTDFTRFAVQVPAYSFTFLGGPQGEQLSFVTDRDRRVSNRIIADTGGGDDTVAVGPGEVDMDGGPGTDLLQIDSALPVFDGAHEGFRPSPFVDLDLGNGVLKFDSSTPLGRVTAVEDVTVDASPHSTGTSAVDLRGDGAANPLMVVGGSCTVAVTGRGGPDLIRASGKRGCPDGTATPRRLAGGAGDDRILGGPGPDLADGGPGIDTCRAEKEVRCER